jgi:hypothetical protein
MGAYDLPFRLKKLARILDDNQREVLYRRIRESVKLYPFDKYKLNELFHEYETNKELSKPIENR